MGSIDTDDANVPWGKYTYALEGLATGCYLEGACEKLPSQKSDTLQGQRLRFRVELPSRCFILSVSVKLPNAPPSALRALEDVEIERTLTNGEYQTVYNPNSTKQSTPDQLPSTAPNRDSPTSVDQTSMKPEQSDDTLSRKKVMEVRRAADSLRITMRDIDDNSSPSPLRRNQGNSSDNESDSGEFRTLGVVVVGYVRGQTPAPNRIKILLNSSPKLGLQISTADRAEVDGLLGLAFLGNRRYRQAAELLQRASELIIEVAQEDAKAGCAPDDAYNWAAELNLLSAYAYFEHMPKSNDGIVRLIHVANAARVTSPRSSLSKELRNVKDLVSEYLDLRTELLVMLEDLLTMLVLFLGESASLAVKLASARMIEFICEQLGCTVAKHLSLVLNQVLRLYPDCKTFGPRERAAAASFSYDSMEDCFERLIDLCCRLFPLTEHSVLHKLYDNTLVPVFLDAFHESRYLCFDDDAEEEADELTTAAVAQTLRVLYLVLTVIGADARIPASLVRRILNILVIDNGNPRTPLLLRRTALHTWDALCKALTYAAKGNTVKALADHIKVLHDYIPRLLVDSPRPSFEYGDVEEESEGEIEIIKEKYVTSDGNTVLKDVLKRRRRRTEIVDRHTLRRLLSLIRDICEALNASDEDEDRYTDIIVALQDTIAHSIANLFMSALIDVSYHEAIMSGNGPAEANNLYEFGDIYTQLSVVAEVLEQLFEVYWTVLQVLPRPKTEEIVRHTSIRSVLGWCVERMSHSAPPRGMLKLLFVTVRGLQNDLNSHMYSLLADADASQEVTFIAIYRSYVPWFSQSTCEEAFDLMDSLMNAVEHDLMATDLSRLIQGIGDQAEQLQSRTDASLEVLANIVASSAPKRPDLALRSLKALEDPSAGNQRIANGFPKSNRSNTGSFTRRLQFSSASRATEPMSKSLYVHVMVASCFDRFDALARASKHRAGPSYMGEKVDAFVEHAALCVRCLHACARARKHRDYMAAVLGDIFSTCLAMQAHNDGRVRLAGFEIFAASLDVLFLAQETKVLLPQQSAMANADIAVMKVASGVPGSGVISEAMNSVTELSPQADSDGPSLRAMPSGSGSDNPLDLVRSNSLPASLVTQKYEEPLDQKKEYSKGIDEDNDIERKMQTIFEEGGSCSFRGEEASSTDFAHEEKAWQMLCAFVYSSLGIGKYVDVVVQRACLEYLKGCMLSALGGKSTGASVIAFEHIELLWESVDRLLGSPWRALSGLALWVMCTIVNVAIYCSVMVKGKGAIRQRSEKLHDFAFQHVFPKAESLLKHDSRETRIWGMRILEVYIKARDMNNGIVQTVPPSPYNVLRALEILKHDWDDDVRESCESLLEVHNSSRAKKSNSQATSFTAQAQNFMSMKRHQLQDIDGSDSSKIELWFPALPTQPRHLNVDVYCRTLEGFANTEVEGGEETEVVRVEEEVLGDEEDFEGEYEEEEEEEGYEYDEEDKDELAGRANGDENTENALEGDEDPASNGAKHLDEGTISHTPYEEGEKTEIKLNDGQIDLNSSEGGVAGSEFIESPVVSAEDSRSEPNGHSLSNDRPNSTNEDDEVDDFEFASSEQQSDSFEETSSATVSDTLVRTEDHPPLGFTVDRNELDDDLMDEEEVIDVTDEDDVLADLESVSSEERPPRRTSGLPLLSASIPISSRQGSGDRAANFKRVGSAYSRGNSPSGPKPELNPDLHEGVHVLRRRGSFTSRPSKKMPSEEGEVPILARRRSLDVGALSSVIETVGEQRLGGSDGDMQSPKSGGARLSRRRSARSPSPASKTVGKSGSGDALKAPLGASELSAENEEQSLITHGGAVKKKSSRDMSISDTQVKATGQPTTPSAPKSSHDQVSSEVVLSHSSTGSGTPSQVKIQGAQGVTDDHEVASLTSPVQVRSSTAEKPRVKPRSDTRSSHPKLPRRLPRAPAFLKGGGPQRKVPAPLPIGRSLEEHTEKTQHLSTSSNTGGHGNVPVRVTSGNAAPKSRLPRARSQTGKTPRAPSTEDSDNPERKTDRTHRFSRREPLRLPLSAADEPDKELLDDLETRAEEVDDLGNRMRVGTPTADALNGRRSLADDEPSSWYKKRTARRDVTDSEHYKSLVDQIGPPAAEDDQTLSGKGVRRDGDKKVSSKAASSSTHRPTPGRGTN